jgi:PAS domain S-box-containing protein
MTKGFTTGVATNEPEDAQRVAERNAASAALEVLFANAPIGFGFVDRDLCLVRLNETLAALTGSTVAAMVGRSVASVVPHLWPKIEARYRQVLATGEAILDVEVDGAIAAEMGTRQWTTSYYPVSADGEVIGTALLVVDTTDRKAADATRQQLLAIVEGSGDAIFGASLEGLVTSWNAAAERLFGFTAEEIIGQPIELIAPEGRVEEQTGMRARLVAGGPFEHLETTRRRKDGTPVEVLITASAATDDAANVVGFSVIAHDITDRRAQQRALEVSREGLAEAQRIAHLGSFEFDVITGKLTWSEEYYRVLGFDQTLPAGIPLFVTALHPDDLARVDRAWRNVVKRGVPFDLEMRIIRPD